ncbi:lyase family protein [Streptomyces sp. NPDC003077]|uniref:lyase family protein n=1 Tax=Streptomyces sp. NPDC003077 TaxID=3154443 RepID=UPI0033A068BB
MPPPPSPSPPSPLSCLDAGLLSPVRAGTPAEEATGDRAWLQAMLDAEAALARAQARLGTVPPAAASVITATASVDALDARALAVGAREHANPVVGLARALTAAVATRDADAAGYVHRGSTSQDVFDTGAMLVAARVLPLIRADLARTAAALGALAAAHRDTPMAGRTLALHAVPTTFGLKAAGWRHLVLDADARLARLLDGGLPVALGGAAGTLAGYLEYARLEGVAGADGDGRYAEPTQEPDGHGRYAERTQGPDGHGRYAERTQEPDGHGRHTEPTQGPDGDDGPGGYLDRLTAAYAEETGLARPALPWHVLRTPVADLGAALAFTAGALGKFAVDVQSLARTEVAEVAEPGPAGRGASSAMPHKRNPVLATMIRAAALQVPALASVLTQAMPSEDERSAGAWHAEWLPLRECLRLAGGAAHTAAELAEGLTVRPERMRANLALTGGRLVSERIAAALTPVLGRAAARALLTDASARATREDRPLAEVLGEAPEVRGAFAPGELAGLCDPAAYTGAAGPLVDRALRR